MKFLKFVIISFCFCAACNQKPSKTSNTPELGLDTVANTFAVTAEDSAMNIAIDKAKNTMEDFDKALRSNNPKYSDFAIKKRYKTDDGGGEHMWISEISISNGTYKGIVNNDAEITKEVKYGDTVFVKKDEITDWMYIDEGILRGGYTIKVIRNQMTKEQQIEREKESGFKIED